jgi:acetyl-CoA C-acetyltransferase
VSEVWIIDAMRTPRAIGKQGKGALSHLHPQHVLGQVLRAIADRHGLDTADIDDVIIGCGTQVGKQGYCIARMAALDAGYDVAASGITVDRFCGSGLSAVNLAAMAIGSGFQDLLIAGGVEFMSYTGGLSRPPLLDAENLSLRDKHPQFSQGLAADVIATLEGFGRADVDAYALSSHNRAVQAVAEGRFDKSLVVVRNDDGSVALDHEQFLRPGTDAATLAALNLSFPALMDRPLDEHGLTHRQLIERTYPGLAINHVHHAGNSSGVVDGAAAVILASPDYARAHDLKPRARIRSIANAGDAPEIMLNAPGPAARKALAKAGMAVGDIDLFEVNEAFATVPMKFIRELGVDRDRVNVNGGAIALGHPIGATGAMLVGTIIDELDRRDLTAGLITLCTGGGMAPATIVERI